MAKKIKINGVIISNDVKWIYDLFEIEATCPKDISAVLDALTGEPVDVEINSGGGNVWAGAEIYYALKAYAGHVTTIIPSIAGSAASVAAVAGDRVLIAPPAQIMIHNVSCTQQGDYRDMQHAAEFLENYNTSIANAYMLKTGMKKEELLDLMNKETWMNAQRAKELKFADEILFDDGNVLTASVYPAAMLPPKVINKIRNLLQKPKEDNSQEALAELERLELLNLRGKVL